MATQWPPRKGIAYTVTFPIYGTLTVPQTGVAGLDSEICKDDGSFIDCTNEAVEIGTTGWYRLTLTATEMDADRIAIQVKTTSMGTIGITIDTIDLSDIAITIPLPADVAFSAG